VRQQVGFEPDSLTVVNIPLVEEKVARDRTERARQNEV
jgi:hypothetical protein